LRLDGRFPPHQLATTAPPPRGGAVVTVVRMDDKVNLAEKVGQLDKPYSPGIVGYLNDFKLQEPPSEDLLI
jgi:hypothetical protein